MLESHANIKIYKQTERNIWAKYVIIAVTVKGLL